MTSSNTPGFADLALSPSVMEALKHIGYEQPSPIQAQAIPHLLNGEDLLGTAQTGTGKTAAFALPLLSRLDLKQKDPQVLVLTPTRELAIQVAEAFKTYAGKMKGFQVLPVYGGQGMGDQLRQLNRGAHVIVGTPGRVMDHLRRGTLKLDKLKTVVLDEGDEMLRMGFIDDVAWILEHTPEQRQVALFSATMPKPIRRIADRYLKSPQVVKIEGQTSTVEKIEQRYWTVSGVKKLDALTRILEVEEFDGIIMFVRTKTQTVELADKLEARGYSAAAINGDMTQKLRERTIDQLKRSRIDILVATDVAARGIDVSRISHVINYDIPYDPEAYVHRIGRTGRAGRSGKAILFVSPRERRLLKAIEKATRQPIQPMELPSREQVNSKRIGQFKDSITATLENENLDLFHSLIQEYLHESSVAPEQLAAALAWISQKDTPLVQREDKPRGKKSHDSPSERPARSKDAGHAAKSEPGKKPPRKKSATFAPDSGEPIPQRIEMDTFRLDVGLEHEVKPGDIVGAIANEADIEAGYIGRIKVFDDHSTVDLPSGMPDELLEHLKKVYIRNRPLRIEHVGKARTLTKSGPKKKKPGKKAGPGKKVKKRPSRA